MKKELSKEEMYRRQLGGVNAALNRARQNERELLALVIDLYNEIPEEVTGRYAERVANCVNRSGSKARSGKK